MNIFFLDNDPYVAAKYHSNKHVCKMIIESCSLLSCAAREKYQKDIGYKSGWRNHPCAKWVMKSDANFCWLFELARGLCSEYSFRYGKSHKCWLVLYELEEIYQSMPEGISCDFTTPYLAMLPEFKQKDYVQAYRDYYAGAKKHLLTYTRREVPWWLKEKGLGIQK